ncbi:MAG: YlxR family protein [bacterium]|nr:YlxR family protein [bacterium]
MNKVILRSCIVTKDKCPKSELLRIVLTKEKEVLVDKNGNIKGRGAYIKKDIKVLNKLKKSNILEKKLRTKVDNKIYDQISSQL